MDINKRSVELRSEAKGILENKQKALDIINKCDMRLLEIQGGLKELDNMVKANAAKLQKPKDIEIIETIKLLLPKTIKIKRKKTINMIINF